MTHPVDSEAEGARFEAETPDEPSAALPAGAIRLPRSRLVAIGILGAGLVIAAAGVLTGMSHSRQGLDSGDGIRVESSGAIPAKPLASTPVMALAGAEPGSDPIGTPVGDAKPPPSEPSELATPSQPGALVAPGGQQTLVRPQDAGSRGALVADDTLSTPRGDRSTVQVASTDGGTPLACLGSQNRVQSVICSDSHLAAADARMRRAFRKALAESDDPDALQAEQARWRSARDRAALQGDAGALADLYSARIRELEPQ